MQIRQTFAPLLAAAVAAVALWSGIAPTDRAVWWAEVTPIFIVYGALLVTARWFRFSNLAYALMSGWMLLHLVGAHYTFANVPFEWGNRLLSPLLGESRNHFDRVAHFIIGLYSYPMAEWLLRRRLGNAGIEFLGSQGDIWDAQKDMLADTLGALTALLLYLVVRPDRTMRVAGQQAGPEAVR